MPHKSLPSRDLLVIDTTLLDGLCVALVQTDGTIITQRTIRTPYGHGEKLLPAISRLLETKKVALPSLQGIIVVSGPGRFSAVRAGVAVANALATAAGVPVVGVAGGPLQVVAARDAKLLNKASHKLVIPAYGQEPSITLKK